MREEFMCNQKGFIMLDVCIASFLCLAVVALIGGFSFLAQLQRNYEAELTAVLLAKEQIARIESKGSDYVATQAACNWLGEGGNIIHKNDFDFMLKTVITAYEGAGNMRRIVVNVTWQDDRRIGEKSFERIIYVP